jgi:hypothetical protein
MRSWNSHRVATVQPSSTSPTRSESGTTTSVKYSWQNSRLPLSISMRWTSMPSRSMGTMNTVSPRCLGTSQFVRARHSPQSDHQAPVVHTLEPLSTHSSPSRTAVVVTPARSDPFPGSERSCIQISSPRRIAGTWRCFWSSVANSSRTAMHGFMVGAWSRIGYSWPVSSSRSTFWCSGVRPWPP